MWKLHYVFVIQGNLDKQELASRCEVMDKTQPSYTGCRSTFFILQKVRVDSIWPYQLELSKTFKRLNGLDHYRKSLPVKSSQFVHAYSHVVWWAIKWTPLINNVHKLAPYKNPKDKFDIALSKLKVNPRAIERKIFKIVHEILCFVAISYIWPCQKKIMVNQRLLVWTIWYNSSIYKL